MDFISRTRCIYAISWVRSVKNQAAKVPRLALIQYRRVNVIERWTAEKFTLKERWERLWGKGSKLLPGSLRGAVCEHILVWLSVECLLAAGTTEIEGFAVKF
jgi:hypothetical protein